jgi:transcription elongation GreA/GreB family factor
VKKSDLRAAIIQQLQLELARQKNAAELARDEAISEESRAENKWDTHSQEAAYLAEGQAKLANEIGASIELYSTLPLPEFTATDAIAVGALVEVEATGDRRSWYFLGPRAGGLELELDGRAVLVLTPQSPLGRQLLGRRVGDAVQTAGRGPSAVQRIVGVM